MARVCGRLSRAIYNTCGSCILCHDNVTRGHRELTSGPVDNERGVTSRLNGPDHYLLSNTNSWDFTQKPQKPPPPSLPVSRGRAQCYGEKIHRKLFLKSGRGQGRREQHNKCRGREQRLATSVLSECKTLTKYFVSAAGRRQGQDRSHPPSKDSF